MPVISSLEIARKIEIENNYSFTAIDSLISYWFATFENTL